MGICYSHSKYTHKKEKKKGKWKEKEKEDLFTIILKIADLFASVYIVSYRQVHLEFLT